jgi:hypothetical protein
MPQGLQAVAGDALVALNWTAVSGATSYTVYWNTTGGVDNTDAGLAAGSNTGFTHGGLTNDTTYYYRVAASNASGEGPLSAERSATPVGPPVVTYSVGGSVTGFTAGTLTLQNNGADDLVLTPAGAYFTFPTMLADGSTYNVTVSVQPDGLTCTVTYLGSGTISGANVTNVGVTCVDNPPATYSVGGTVSGLSGTVTLQNNGADALEVAANGSFTFATVVNDGSSYAVTVSTQPAAQTCAVINGSGTISGANVNNVELTCVDNTPSSDASLTSLSLSTGPFNQVFQSTLYSYTATVAYSTSSTMVTAVAAQGGTLSINGIEATSGVASDPIALTEGANTISVSVTSQDGTSNQTYTLTVTRAGIAVSGWTHPLDEFSYINPDGAGGAMVTAMNNNGQAIAAWRAYDGSTDCGASGGAACFQVFISQYQNGSWTTPPDLSSNISPDGFHAYPPQVAISDNGDAVVVWQMNTSWTSPCGNVTFQCSHIYMSEYRNGSWTHPTDINDYIDPANTNNVSQTPTVAMDSSGNTIIVWRNFAGGVYKSEYRNGSWVHPQNISDDIPLSYWNPTVAMDDNGNALIVWQGVDSIYNNRIYLSEYRNGAWSHPSNLNTDAINPPGQACPGITCSIPVKIAMDNNDNAIVVWDQRTTSYSDYSDGSIYKSEYRNGAWTHPADVDDKVSLGSDLDWARYPEVAMDDNGNALIIWSQNDETMDCDVPFGINRMVPGPCKQLFMSEYRDGSWTYPLSMSDHISPTGQPVASVSGYQSYSLAMGNTGEAVIAWSQSIPSDICGGTPDRQVFVSEYRDGGWSHPVDSNDYLIDLNIFSYLPLATMDNSGNVLLGWNSLASNLFFSEYHCPGCVTTLPEVIAPRNLQATAADAMVNLSWQEVSNANYYNIYWSTTGVASTSDNLITGISGGTYQHTDLTNKTNYSYFVTAVVSTTESLPSGHASARPSACIGCEPALTSTLLSGSISIDEGNGIAVDSAGNVFVTGYTFGDMDGNISNGSSDIFISKYSGGTRQWTVQPGTADYETGDGIALDADGNIYIVGTGFLLSKYNSVGVLQWSVPVDYNSAMGFGIDLDPTGNVYITGVTTIGLDGNTSQGGADIFISKYDATGTRQWTAQTGTTGNDQGNAIAVDSAGNAYVTGYTLVTGTYTGSSFITKYSTDGDLLWFDEFAWPVGTQYMDRANDIALDADDNAYITGYTNYWLFQNYSLNGFEVYVAKYNTDGCLQWTSQRGVSGSFDYSYGIAVDGDANVFVTGETQGALDGNSFAGERDIFIMKFDSKGIHSWTKQYGEAGIDSGKAIAVDASGNIYTTGSSDGSLNGEVSIGDGSIYNYDVFMMTHSSQE